MLKTILIVILLMIGIQARADSDFSYEALKEATKIYMSPDVTEEKLVAAFYKGNGYMSFLLGRCFRLGYVCKNKKNPSRFEFYDKNNSEIKRILESKINEGALPKIWLGWMALNQGNDEGYKKALDYFLQDINVDEFHDLRDVLLADMYLNGKGVEKDYDKANDYYSGVFRYSIAYYQLGYIYENRLFGEKRHQAKRISNEISDKQALSYYTAAAEANDFDAKARLYEIYSHGLLGVDIDQRKALKYLTNGVLTQADIDYAQNSMNLSLREIIEKSINIAKTRSREYKEGVMKEACDDLKYEIEKIIEEMNEKERVILSWISDLNQVSKQSNQYENIILNYNISVAEFNEIKNEYNSLKSDYNEKCANEREEESLRFILGAY